MKLKVIILILMVPTLGFAQSFNVNELIKLREMNKEQIDKYFSDTNWQYGGFNSNQHWWKTSKSFLTLELTFSEGENIIHLMTMDNETNKKIQDQISDLGMEKIKSNIDRDGVLQELYANENFVIVLMKTYNNYGEMVIKTTLMKKDTYDKFLEN